MKYKVDLQMEAEGGLIEYIKDLESKRDRSEIIITEKEKINIHIESEDATALRASLDGICQRLKIWETTKGIENG